MQENNLFEKLPNDCIFEILSFIEPKDGLFLSSVNKHFPNKYTSPELWKFYLNNNKLLHAINKIYPIKSFTLLEFKNALSFYIKQQDKELKLLNTFFNCEPDSTLHNLLKNRSSLDNPSPQEKLKFIFGDEFEKYKKSIFFRNLSSSHSLKTIKEVISFIQEREDFLNSINTQIVENLLHRQNKGEDITRSCFKIISSTGTLSEKVNKPNIVKLDGILSRLTDKAVELLERQNVSQLNLDSNELVTLPANFTCLKSLKVLSLGYNQLTNSQLPSFSSFLNLKELDISMNLLTSFPESITSLKGLKNLFIGNDEPKEMDKRVGNKITYLPSSITNMIELELLSAPRVKLEILPEKLGEMTKLKNLGFTGNNISYLPKSLRHWKEKRRLFVDRNPITEPGAMISLIFSRLTTDTKKAATNTLTRMSQSATSLGANSLHSAYSFFFSKRFLQHAQSFVHGASNSITEIEPFKP